MDATYHILISLYLQFIPLYLCIQHICHFLLRFHIWLSIEIVFISGLNPLYVTFFILLLINIFIKNTIFIQLNFLMIIL